MRYQLFHRRIIIEIIDILTIVIEPALPTATLIGSETPVVTTANSPASVSQPGHVAAPVDQAADTPTGK